MPKVAFISFATHSRHLNYGATLHGWAFQQVLRRMGCESVAIDYVPQALEGYSLKWPLLNALRSWRSPALFVRRVASALVSTRANLRKFRRFAEFTRTRMAVTPQVYTEKSLLAARSVAGCEDVRVFVCESDVIWKRRASHPFDCGFYLDFPAAEGRRKVAYAPSLSATPFPPREEERFARLAGAFDAVSAREREGAEYASRVLGREVPWMPDPTLLLSASDYLEIAKPPRGKGYVLLYTCMNFDANMVREARKLAARLGKRLVEVGNFGANRYVFGHETVDDAGVEEWLGLFANADAVVCNSFHGICFSVVFRKPFFVFRRRSNDTRFQSICRELGLEDRLLDIGAAIPQDVPPVDFDRVARTLGAVAERARAFIRENIVVPASAPRPPRRTRIALCRLDVANVGDRIISDTAEGLLRRVLGELGRDDVSIVPVNIGSDDAAYGALPPKSLGRTLFHAVRRAARLAKKSVRAGWYLRWQWHRSPVYGRYAAAERPRLMGADLVVFAGGGLVKFRRQNFHFFIDDVTALADRLGIPVIFNAVGVEGYDGRDGECRLLKRALGRRCVKSVTTRDDLETLVARYLDGDAEGKAGRVCDPALWTPETYGIFRAPDAGRTIGLNAIRPGVFAEYSRRVGERFLVDLYADVAKALLARGWRVEIFSNGAVCDGEFVRALFAAHPELRDDPAVTQVLPETPEEFVRTVAGYARILAARLHAAIVATSLGVPNASLVWHDKQTLFGRIVGMEGNFIGPDGFDAANVARRILDAKPWEADGAYRASIVEALRRDLARWLPPRKESAR